MVVLNLTTHSPTHTFTFYQIGKSGSPAIYSADMTRTTWDWQTVQLVSPAGGPNGNRPAVDNGRASKGLSGGTITAIVVVAILIVVLTIVGLLLRRRRNQEAFNQDQVEKGVPGAVTSTGPPPSLPPLSPAQPSMYSSATSAAGSTVAGLSGAAAPTKQEVSPSGGSHRGPPHLVTRDWSHGSLTSGTMPYPSNQTTTVGDPLSTTTMPSVNVYAPSSPLRTNAIVGDKQELESETQSPSIAYLELASSAPSSSGSPTVGIAPDPRVQAMISPGLANAQLILQQSQSPATMRTEGNYR